MYLGIDYPNNYFFQFQRCVSHFIKRKLLISSFFYCSITIHFSERKIFSFIKKENLQLENKKLISCLFRNIPTVVMLLLRRLMPKHENKEKFKVIKTFFNTLSQSQIYPYCFQLLNTNILAGLFTFVT